MTLIAVRAQGTLLAPTTHRLQSSKCWARDEEERHREGPWTTPFIHHSQAVVKEQALKHSPPEQASFPKLPARDEPLVTLVVLG